MKEQLKYVELDDMFLKRLNDIRRKRCISIEKEMNDFFVRRTLSVKALRAMCLGVCCGFIGMNALQAKLKMGKILNIINNN